MECSVGIVRERSVEGNWQVKGGCGKVVEVGIYTMTREEKEVHGAIRNLFKLPFSG